MTFALSAIGTIQFQKIDVYLYVQYKKIIMNKRYYMATTSMWRNHSHAFSKNTRSCSVRVAGLTRFCSRLNTRRWIKQKTFRDITLKAWELRAHIAAGMVHQAR